MSYFTQMMVHEGFWPEDLSAKFFEAKQDQQAVEWLNEHDCLKDPSQPPSIGEDEIEIILPNFHCSDKKFLKAHPRPERMLAFIRRQRKLRRVVVTKDYPELSPITAIAGRKMRKIAENEKIIPAKWTDYNGQKLKKRDKRNFTSDYGSNHHRTNPNKELRIVQHISWIDQEMSAETFHLKPETSTKIKLPGEGVIHLSAGSDGVLETANCRVYKKVS